MIDDGAGSKNLGLPLPKRVWTVAKQQCILNFETTEQQAAKHAAIANSYIMSRAWFVDWEATLSTQSRSAKESTCQLAGCM